MRSACHIRPPVRFCLEVSRRFEAELEAAGEGVLVLGAPRAEPRAAPFSLGLALDALDALEALLVGYERAVLHLRTRAGPVIASVDGAAIGGGLGLAAATDWVVATTRARFGLPEARYGLAPAMVLAILADRMPEQKARALALTLESIDAETALRIGLVDELVAPEDLERTLARRARVLRRPTADGVRAIKARPEFVGALRERLRAGRAQTLNGLRSDEVRRRIQAQAEFGVLGSAT